MPCRIPVIRATDNARPNVSSLWTALLGVMSRKMQIQKQNRFPELFNSPACGGIYNCKARATSPYPLVWARLK